MPFEGRPLREITEAELRQLVNSSMIEHLYLDYKGEAYGNDDRGCREHLQDVCMFASAQGGLLLVGIAEQRDPEGQPTGIPDPGAMLGLELPNPEAVLLSYDARVVSCIEERLRIESYAIEVGEGRYVLAFRVPNSATKPHCVRYKGQVYFPSRRERHRCPMSVHDIKELTMKTATQLDLAREILAKSIDSAVRGGTDLRLSVGVMPIFFQDFMVDIKNPDIFNMMGFFDVSGANGFRYTQYNFEGLERPEDAYRATVTLMRHGLVRLHRWIATRAGTRDGARLFSPIAIDSLIRRFVSLTQNLYRVTSLSGPVLLSARLSIPGTFFAEYGNIMEGSFHKAEVGPADYNFSLLIDVLEEPVERAIRPICDHVHQTFGQGGSPNFDAAGAWVGQA